MADITTLAVQKVIKPDIEDVLPHYLEGEMLKNALDFIAYLRENKMKPTWTLHNAWKAVYKGKVLYYIRLPVYESHFYRPNQPNERSWERSWCVTPYLLNIAQYQHLITDEGEQKIVLDNLYGCLPNCNKRCSSETKIPLFGKEIIRYCGGTFNNRSLWIVNPDETEMNSIKKFFELEKDARDENAVQSKKIKDTVNTKVSKLGNGIKFHENFNNFDPTKCKAADMLPLFDSVPQILEVICDDDGAKCLCIETPETPRNKRRGFIVAEGIKMDGELAVEVKVKPIDGLDGVFELWLLGGNDEHLCLTLNATHAGKFALEAAHCDDIAISKYKPKFLMNEWYYLHIQLKKDEINMALLNADRVLVDKRTFDTSAGFNRFDIALAHSLGPRTKKTYLFKSYVKGVTVADCNAQDLSE